MTNRTFVYGKLISYAPLTDLIGGSLEPRVFAKKSMTSSKEDTPYIVYKLGNATDQNFSEEVEIGTQFLQIWVHDFSNEEVANYKVIDDIIEQIRNAFRFTQSPDDGVIMSEYIETSEDLNDDTLNTIFRYVRLQLITKETN